MSDEGLEETARTGDPWGAELEAAVAAEANAWTAARASAAQRLAGSGRPGPALDRLAQLAAMLLRTEFAQVSLISDVEHVAGAAGLPAGSVGSTSALVDSLCARTVELGEPLVVDDARDDRGCPRSRR